MPPRPTLTRSPLLTPWRRARRAEPWTRACPGPSKACLWRTRPAPGQEWTPGPTANHPIVFLMVCHPILDARIALSVNAHGPLSSPSSYPRARFGLARRGMRPSPSPPCPYQPGVGCTLRAPSGHCRRLRWPSSRRARIWLLVARTGGGKSLLYLLAAASALPSRLQAGAAWHPPIARVVPLVPLGEDQEDSANRYLSDLHARGLLPVHLH